MPFSIRLYALVVLLKTNPISDHNGQNQYPFSDQNGSKSIFFGAAHTYIADIKEYPLGEVSICRKFLKGIEFSFGDQVLKDYCYITDF